MATVTTNEFIGTIESGDTLPFSLIEQKGLTARLIEELKQALAEFTRDPRGFIRELFHDEKRDAKRRRMIYALLAAALVVHIALVAVIAIIGWRAVAEPKPELSYIVIPLDPHQPKLAGIKDPESPEPPGGNGGKKGGGGGEASTLATKGVTPQSVPQLPVVPLNQPVKQHPALPTPTYITGPESAPPPPDATIGIPTSKIEGPPSPGMGKDGGIGEGDGPGIGSNKGPGGPGGGPGGNGKGNNGPPGGTGGDSTPTVFAFNTPKPAGYNPFSWIYRPTPVVTPEAQANKVSGVVLLRATFHADGRITNIEVVRSVDFMTESAIAALQKSRFRPATINGKPITVTRVLVQIKVQYGGAA